MTAGLLPRHDPVNWREKAAASQRDRLLVAMAESTVELGFAHTRVADVIALAGVSRRTFYEHFRDLEACFLATYDRGVEALTEFLSDALTDVGPAVEWTAILGRLLATYLEVLATEPVFTQLALVEVLGAGHEARTRYLAVVDRFHALLRSVDDLACRQDPHRRPTGDLALSVFAGGLNRLVMTEVLAGRGRELAQHYDELLVLGIRMLTTARAGLAQASV